MPVLGFLSRVARFAPPISGQGTGFSVPFLLRVGSSRPFTMLLSNGQSPAIGVSGAGRSSDSGHSVRARE
jgi:hypothetical protein